MAMCILIQIGVFFRQFFSVTVLPPLQLIFLVRFLKSCFFALLYTVVVIT